MLIIEISVGILAFIEERSDSSELLTECVLRNIKASCFTPDVSDLVGLEGRNMLLDSDGDLLCVVPLFGQLLQLLVDLQNTGEDNLGLFII